MSYAQAYAHQRMLDHEAAEEALKELWLETLDISALMTKDDLNSLLQDVLNGCTISPKAQVAAAVNAAWEAEKQRMYDNE